MKLSEFIEAGKRLYEEYGDLEIKTFHNGEYKIASIHLSSCSETGHFISILNQPRWVWELYEDTDGTFRSSLEPLGLFVRSESLAKEFAKSSLLRSYVMTFETPAMMEVLAVDDATLLAGLYKQRKNIEDLKKQRELGG